jgi:hypothetical protein
VQHKRHFASKIRQKWNVIQTDVWLDIICGSCCGGSLCARWMDVWLAKLKPSWATRPSVSISHQQRPLSTVPLQYIPIRITLTLSSLCHRRTASLLLLCISSHSRFFGERSFAIIMSLWPSFRNVLNTKGGTDVTWAAEEKRLGRKWQKWQDRNMGRVKGLVKFALEQATKAQRGVEV